MWNFWLKESISLFLTSNLTWRLLKHLDLTIVQQSVEKNEISSENLYTQKFSCQTCQGSFSWSWCQEKNSFFQALFWHLHCTFIFDFCCNKIQYVRDYMAIQVFDNAQLYVSTLAWPHFWSTLLQPLKYRFLLKQLCGCRALPDITSAHCSYLDIYISQKIRLCKGDF